MPTARRPVPEGHQTVRSAGAAPVMPIADMLRGARDGQFRDPFGHAWSVSTQTEDLTPQAVAGRAQAFVAAAGQEPR